MKKGYTREDGKIFWSYDKKAKNGEYWVTPERFLSLIENKKRHEKNRVRDKEKMHCYKISWRKNNIEKARLAQRNWNKLNKDKLNSIYAKRRSRIKNAILMLHRDQEKIIDILYSACRRISKCIGIIHHIDHIQPISKGGYHIHTNLQILPATTNLKKSNYYEPKENKPI